MYTATKDENISNLKSSAQNLREAANDVTGETREDLRQAANRAGKKVRSFLHTAGDELTHAKDNVTTQIRTKPVQSSAIALGVGVLLGILLRRR